jgi:hypothetical protein
MYTAKTGPAKTGVVCSVDSAQWSSDLPPKIEIVGDRARWTAVRRDQLPPVADPFIEG